MSLGDSSDGVDHAPPLPRLSVLDGEVERLGPRIDHDVEVVVLLGSTAQHVGDAVRVDAEVGCDHRCRTT